MSSTRHAKLDAPFRQERYLSSPEFELALKAHPVARRCELVREPKERELIWWLQYKSHQEGGFDALSLQLIESDPAALTTPSMRKFGCEPGKIYNADQVRAIRAELGSRSESIIDDILSADDSFPLSGEEGEFTSRKHPHKYAAKLFVEFCQKAALNHLPATLRDYCLNPAARLSDNGQWYFYGLRTSLFRFMKAEAEQLRSGTVITQIGRRVERCLDMALKTRSLVMANGVPRIGKSHAARAWCQQNSGLARFVEVPASNDDVGFFRALARGLGLGNFMKYKATEIRERVEAVLITGQLLLVLDEAHRLWPQMNYRYGHPNRINWLMSMVNQGVPICALTTPQFFTHLHHVEQYAGWASEQLIGRITHHEQLPAELSAADLEAVARAVIPEAGEPDIKALVAYARSSAKYLAAIDSIAKSARYLAGEGGREDVRRSDIQLAMKEGVIPSDRSLDRVLQATAGRKSRKPGEIHPGCNPIAEPLSEANNRLESGSQSLVRKGEFSSAGQPRTVRPAGDLIGA